VSADICVRRDGWFDMALSGTVRVVRDTCALRGLGLFPNSLRFTDLAARQKAARKRGSIQQRGSLRCARDVRTFHFPLALKSALVLLHVGRVKRASVNPGVTSIG
jgi:hypothetical protein